jgi:hypothetical protein
VSDGDGELNQWCCAVNGGDCDPDERDPKSGVQIHLGSTSVIGGLVVVELTWQL